MKKIAIAFLLVMLAPAWTRANGNEVVVIYNKRVPESKGVAEYYAEKRHVPKEQIFGFDLPTTPDMSRGEFRKELQKPLADTLEKKNLWRIRSVTVNETNGKPARVEWKVTESKIRYAVLCYGVPIQIAADPTLKEPATEHLRPELRRNEAAVDSELALLPLIEQNLLLSGPLRNPLYSATNAVWFHPTNGLLMVARLDGPTAGIARGLVDKALQAEANGFWGRAYIDLRSITDTNMKAGEDWIRSAGDICKQLGFETIVDTNGGTFPASFPMSQIAFYAGWYEEHVSGPFTRPTVEFMPGAFAYHLHSYSGANLRTPNKNWVGPFLAKGVTITMGTVDEPYLAGTPDIGVFAARLIFHTMTFGEAAYAAQNVLSWQTTIVGDPLYRPFGKPPQQLHEELERRKSDLVEWSHLRVVNLNLARGSTVADVTGYLEQTSTTTNSAVLTEKLGDLYAAQGKPASAIEAYQHALQRHPSPLQRIRLHLILGEKLEAANRDDDAYQNYQKLLQESSDYGDKPSVYRKLLLLAQKLGKKDEAAKWEEQLKQPPAETPKS